VVEQLSMKLMSMVNIKHTAGMAGERGEERIEEEKEKETVTQSPIF
jgi:hypothetical protein